MSEIKHKNVLQMIIGLVLAGILIFLDQLSKVWVYNTLQNIGSIPLIKGVFSFTYARNPGAAWGIMGGSVILNILPIIIAIVIIFAYQRIPATKRMLPLNLCLIALFSGAVSNRIDRSLYGYVQDFLYFEPIDFPIFNIADCYIVISAFLLAFLFIFYYKDENEFKDIFSFKKK